MANQWFCFKKFTVRQDRCAMKVGTDAVILGAWTPVEGKFRALDIGTGTGILAMMLAQRSDALNILALELDTDAAVQATQNIAGSDFYRRINVLQMDFRNYYLQPEKEFDLIICNPPYFINSQRPADEGRSLARHSESLRMKDIFAGSAKLLQENGHLSMIIPADVIDVTIESAKVAGLYPESILNIHPLPGVEPKRVCLLFSFEEKVPLTESLVIEYSVRHNYTEEYQELTREFYLNF